MSNTNPHHADCAIFQHDYFECTCHLYEGDVKPMKDNINPDHHDKKQKGMKFDSGKSPVRKGLLEYFPRACLSVAELSAFGAEKYDWGNWEHVENAIERYGNAQVRHICDAAIQGEKDLQSGLLHATHEAWNSLVRLELLLREIENAPK